MSFITLSQPGTLMEMAEIIANNAKLPGDITDWASDCYDLLVNKSAVIRVEDVLLLEYWRRNGQDSGLMAVDAALARRR